jgi:hypothetical protein
MFNEYNNNFRGQFLICEDCLFELGLTEYEDSYMHNNRRRYICKRCGEIIPAKISDRSDKRLIDFLIKADEIINKEKPYIPQWLRFQKDCRYFRIEGTIVLFEEQFIFNKCYHRIETRRIPYKNRKKLIPDICLMSKCPLFEMD